MQELLTGSTLDYLILDLHESLPDRKRYSEFLGIARASDAIVTTILGCIVESEMLRTVANKLDSGKYDSWLRWMETLSL